MNLILKTVQVALFEYFFIKGCRIVLHKEVNT